jgi:hypothetical protein
MGLPLEQWRGGEADGKEAAAESPSSSAGYRTPAGNNGQRGDCPAAPRKTRAPAGVVSQQQQRRDYYNGADVDAFFAAHNL